MWGGMQWCIDGCTEGLVKVCRGCTEVYRVHRGAWRDVYRCMEVYRRCTKVSKGTQRCAEMYRGMHRFAEGCTEVC